MWANLGAGATASSDVVRSCFGATGSTDYNRNRLVEPPDNRSDRISGPPDEQSNRLFRPEITAPDYGVSVPTMFSTVILQNLT